MGRGGGISRRDGRTTLGFLASQKNPVPPDLILWNVMRFAWFFFFLIPSMYKRSSISSDNDAADTVAMLPRSSIKRPSSGPRAIIHYRYFRLFFFFFTTLNLGGTFVNRNRGQVRCDVINLARGCRGHTSPCSA